MRDVLDRTVRERTNTHLKAKFVNLVVRCQHPWWFQDSLQSITWLQGLSQGFQDPPPSIMWLGHVSEVPGPAKCITWLQGLHWGSMTQDKDVTLLKGGSKNQIMHQNCVFVCVCALV